MSDDSNPKAKGPQTRDPDSKGLLHKFNRAVNGSLERVFTALGRFIARRPIVVIVATLIVAAALGTGVMQLENEERYA